MMNLDTEVRDRLNTWLTGSYDQDTKQQLIDMLDANDSDGLIEAFYKELEFGTGGMRGIMGPGSNRVNKYTIGTATQGFANYLTSAYPGQEVSVAIAHDSRNNSDVFANVTADVFSANGIKVYMFDSLRPTPELSFAIRTLGCQGGVVLTASHNPREYNGYKAYGADGGQLVSPADKAVIAEVRKISSVDEVKFDRIAENVKVIGAEIDQKYHKAILTQTMNQEAIDRQKDLKIVFSPIHGTGAVSVPPVLHAKGFTNVTVVEEQMKIDGNFPTVIYPNPEEEEAMTMALNKAREIDADLVMATDPDADRVGIACRNSAGEFVLLNGNQTAALLVQYMLDAWQAAGKLDGSQYIVKTVVTSYLLDKIAESKGVDCYNTLTGFKHIGAVMTKLEGQKTFIVGGEESYGYSVGEHSRDKDAVVSCAMIAEMTAYYKDKGMTLYDALIDLHDQYGVYEEKLVAITKKGKSGAEEIAAMMTGYRDNPPATLGGSKVVMIKDYQKQISKDLLTGDETPIDLPQSNVLQFYTEDGSIVSARPSGTEPKIKFYCSVSGKLTDKANYEVTREALGNRIEALMGDLN